MSLTKGKLEEEGISVYKLAQYLGGIPGAEATYPTIMRRLADQQWSYLQARALQIAGLWEIEQPHITKGMVRQLYSGRIYGVRPEEVIIDTKRWNDDGRYIGTVDPLPVEP